MWSKQSWKRTAAKLSLPLMLLALTACAGVPRPVTPLSFQITYPASVTDPCPRLQAFDWNAYWALDEEGRARYAGARDAGHEANENVCEGRKDDAVAIGADANRRIREAADRPRRRRLFH